MLATQKQNHFLKRDLSGRHKLRQLSHPMCLLFKKRNFVQIRKKRVICNMQKCLIKVLTIVSMSFYERKIRLRPRFYETGLRQEQNWASKSASIDKEFGRHCCWEISWSIVDRTQDFHTPVHLQVDLDLELELTLQRPPVVD